MNEVEIRVKVDDQTREGYRRATAGSDEFTKKTSSNLKQSESKFGLLGKAAGLAGGAVKAGAVVGVAGLGLLGGMLVQGVKDAQSFQVLQQKTAAVIKSTGNEAHISVEGVQNLAASLESMSGVDEELIINAQNVLATFTNIRNVGKDKIFDTATQSVLDMSVALGGDMQGAAIQVGKALNDPVKGVTALSKVGVSFTADQKKVIASLVKTGDVAGAQKIILAELNKEFGGQAKEAGDSFEGSMARMQDALADTGRSIGQELLPKLTEAADWLGEKIPVAVEDFKNGWQGIGDTTEIGSLAESLHNLSDQLAGLTKQAGETKGNGFVQFAHVAIDALTTVSEGFEMLGANWGIVTGTISKWNDTISINFQKMIVNIAKAGAKLPGPMGRHFKKIAADGQREINRLQGRLDKTNTKLAQSRINALEIKLRHLGRQKPTPKVNADIAAAQDKIARISAKLHNIKDEYVSVYISEVKRDNAMAARGHAHGGIIGAATGGNRGGLVMVGEHGRELVRLPYGSTVIPNGATENGLKAGKDPRVEAAIEAVRRRILPRLKAIEMATKHITAENLARQAVKDFAKHGGGGGGSGGGGGGGLSGTIRVIIDGTGVMAGLRKEIRYHGGNVQVVLGKGKG